ncbi:YjgF/Yer057p/UK114 family [Penicillium sp. DV-2018c]|nr:YjgF/Yer057p/UK114 family [Penicillium sp. DV-2018c]
MSTSAPPPAPGLNVIALISGGKDSLYSILHCIRNGHKVVALANLYPEPKNKPTTTTTNPQNEEEDEEDIDSFMYQTIGHSVIPLYEQALQIPLYRQPITGNAVDTARIYGTTTNTADETESLVPLLNRIKQAHPEANAVSAGAILSTYQRTRIENVANRLGLVPLAWLWMYPSLPAPGARVADTLAIAQAGLLEDMAAVRCDARIIKVASGGLDEGFLWENVSGVGSGGRMMRRCLVKAMSRFADREDIRGAVLGEGGEFETLALDGPGFLWKGRIEVGGREKRGGEGGVAFVRLRGARCVGKSGGEVEDGVKPGDVRRPGLLDAALEGVLGDMRKLEPLSDVSNSVMSSTTPSPTWSVCEPVHRLSGSTWTISNIVAPEAGPGAGEQMKGIANKVEQVLASLRHTEAGSRSTDDIVFATVLLSSMADFGSMNDIYVSLFKKPNPPARVTVACGDRLPSNVKVMVTFVVDLGAREQRQGLHVQSRSYWAPANIGPYSQAISTPLQNASRIVYIAGQIPLDPASMNMAQVEGPGSWLENYRLRAVLALQHLWRIGESMQVDWWLGAVAFLARGEHADTKAREAWHLWDRMHALPDNEDEDDDEGPQLDAWDIKYGRRTEELTDTPVPTLPKFTALVESHTCIPPFLAVQVDELPRGSEIEWQGLGGRCEQVKLDIKGGIFSTTMDGQYKYTSIEIDAAWCHEFTVEPRTRSTVAGKQHSPDSQRTSRRSSTIQSLPASLSQKPAPRVNDLLRIRRPSPPLSYSRSSRTTSDSGTEADDESTGILRGLPAPPLRPRKGLRANDTEYWPPSPQPWPSFVRPTPRSSRRSPDEEFEEEAFKGRRKLQQRRIEVFRRLLEAALLLSVGGVVLYQDGARALAWEWRKEIVAHSLVVLSLSATYPLVVRASQGRRWRLWPVWSTKRTYFSLPPSFDPAPLLYPILIPIFVSLSLSSHPVPLILPNIILSLSSLPTAIIPLRSWTHGFNVIHWMVSMFPVLVSEHFSLDGTLPKPLTLRGLDVEFLLLLFPLHQALIPTLDFLLTTSVLPAELQLLTTALINLYLFAASPQMEILKALLWLGGMCLFACCRQILHWEVSLARIPNWKFRRAPTGSQSARQFLNMMDHRLCEKLSKTGPPPSDDASSDSEGPRVFSLLKPRRTRTMRENRSAGRAEEPSSEVEKVETRAIVDQHAQNAQRRRHTISTFDEAVLGERVRTTPGGRRKKLMGPNLASFLSLTSAQAQVRKWLYAGYVYVLSLIIILGPVRKYIAERALQGQDPFGWAIGYLLGNLSRVRFWILMLNLEYWVELPPRPDAEVLGASCLLGSVEHIRQATFGAANTRLLLSGYCLLVLLTGLAIVVKLSSVVEVDTRRKIFHGMMVVMFLPSIFVDPAFCSMALALVLSIFLLLDLFRASQLPPISRPLTNFLAPYVDGRDHRGPVIISHIFLLIGCSIPLWLSLSDLPRSGIGPWAGWEIQSRDVSMASGVICVGMGDAAASLVGRRYGRLKWFWGGGKSLEGSIAFVAAVTCGLIAVRAWLVFGGWPVSAIESSEGTAFSAHFWGWTFVKAVLAAGGTSATEAILTGCNDNVVVPVVLWLLVRGLGV